MKRLDVIGLGLAAVDIVIVVDALPTWEVPGKAFDLQIGGGGPAATAAAAACRLGCSTGFVGTFGCDDFGTRKRDELAEAGLDVSQMVRRDHPEDQMIIVYVERATGERLFVGVARESEKRRFPLAADELDKGYIQSAEILHIDGCHPEAALAAAQWIHQAGGKVMYDGGTRTRAASARSISNVTRELVAQADYLICGAGFTSALTGIPDGEKAVVAAASVGPEVVVETMGAQGSWTAVAGESFFTPAFEVDVVDTTGAGDVFHGAFLAGLVNGWPIQVICRFATAASAIGCTRLGGRAGCPTLSDVKTFFKERHIEYPEVS